jgi:K+-transporting ATPase ATPase A chain
MHLYTMLQYGVFLLIVTALVYPIGGYLMRVFGGESTWLDSGLRPLERVFYRLAGIDAQHEMDWKEYARAFLFYESSHSCIPLIPSINLPLLVPTWR